MVDDVFMKRELLLKILVFVDGCSANSKAPIDNAGVPDFLNDIDFDELQEHLRLLKIDGLIDATYSSGEWRIEGLTLKGHDELGKMLANEPTPVEVLQELVKAIRQTSEQAESVAREANDIAKQSLAKSHKANEIATGANTRQSLSIFANIVCAIISSGLMSGAVSAWMVSWLLRQ